MKDIAEQYEAEKAIIINENNKYINKFGQFLLNQGLTDKTIGRHIENVSFYVNEYLNYYEITPLEDGCHYMLHNFFESFFVRKCLWSSKESAKQMSASLRKFYKYMASIGRITDDDYEILHESIKDNLKYWLTKV